MDGQNFENENNVTVDTTATEVSSAAETVQETPVTEQPVNNYQDYTANVQPQAAATAPVQQPENKENNVLAIVSLVLGILSIVLGCCTGWIGALFGIGGIICAVFANKQGKTGLAKAGLICSIIGIVLGIIITILAAVFSVGLAVASLLAGASTSIAPSLMMASTVASLTGVGCSSAEAWLRPAKLNPKASPVTAIVTQCFLTL